jgi:hypothetical protein
MKETNEDEEVQYWSPGDHIVMREVWQARVWTARPVTVVRDTPDLLALYMMPGTRYKHPRTLDGSSIPPFLADDWMLVDVRWQGCGALYLSIPGAWHMVILFWQTGQPAFPGWYVNLQEPLRRTPLGFDFLDQELDILISPDLSTWAWKDEAKFETAIERGRIAPEQARHIRAEGERVLAQLHAPNTLFTQGWELWVPPADWTIPELPPNWDRV